MANVNRCEAVTTVGIPAGREGPVRFLCCMRPRNKPASVERASCKATLRSHFRRRHSCSASMSCTIKWYVPVLATASASTSPRRTSVSPPPQPIQYARLDPQRSLPTVRRAGSIVHTCLFRLIRIRHNGAVPREVGLPYTLRLGWWRSVHVRMSGRICSLCRLSAAQGTYEGRREDNTVDSPPMFGICIYPVSHSDSGWTAVQSRVKRGGSSAISVNFTELYDLVGRRPQAGTLLGVAISGGPD
ncbi:hypothetical protein C8Q73DRAFT_368004 [Cubamyces lactineus]|nr:hypothetical protein C8Q73DRAFT_368004 [Cubamyces lactineus]